jgi:hypothetical protein
MPAITHKGRTVEEVAVISPHGLGGLEIPAHDYVGMSYTGSNLTGVVYKTGGASGTTVATLVLAYDGSDNLVSVTRS